MNGETIAAIATAPGRAGVAVVRLSGPDVREIAARLGATDLAPGRIRFRRLHAPGDPSRTLDEAVVLFFAAPHSYTGEDVVEFQTHGGAVLPRRVLEASLAAGARLARRGEFTQRAYLSGRLDYEQAEAVLAAVDAKTDRAADAALAALSGCGARALRGFYERALELSSTFEHALDVSEEELPDDFLAAQAAAVAALRSEIERELARRREGRLLRDGALVVLAGPPNAGKSSLLNALLGEHRAIVSDTPGTTRDSIEEGLDLGGWPVRLTDTAGLRATADRIEDEGVRRAEALIERAALVVYLSDDATAPEPPIKGETLLVQSKSDLRGGSAAPGWLAVSATTGDGLDALKREIVRRLERFAAIAPEPADAVQASRLNETLALFPTADESGDIVLLANRLRTIAEKLGSFIGAVYSEDLLDRLFSRFCVGK